MQESNTCHSPSSVIFDILRSMATGESSCLKCFERGINFTLADAVFRSIMIDIIEELG